MVQGKCRNASFKTKKKLLTKPEDWIVVENTHEPIVDDFTWERVQQRLNNRNRIPSNNSIRVNKADDTNVFSGIISCADCGAAMAFNRKVHKDGSEKRFYRCSRYANSGSKSCTMHTLDAEILENVILNDIQRHSKKAVQNENRLLSRLLDFSFIERRNENALREKALRETVSRIEFIQDATKKLFEEKVIGNVPDSIFKKMLVDYENEVAGLEEKIRDLRQSIEDGNNSEQDVQRWLELIKKCAVIDRLDRATAFQLIDHVTVNEQKDECGIRTQNIQVKYNFVGCLN